MIRRGRGLAGLGLGDRNAALLAEGEQLLLGLGIEHAAAADHEGLLSALQRRDRLRQFPRVRALATNMMRALGEETLGVVVGLGLHVLTEGERDRAAFGGVGQHGERARQRGHDLLGPRDAVEVT